MFDKRTAYILTRSINSFKLFLFSDATKLILGAFLLIGTERRIMQLITKLLLGGKSQLVRLDLKVLKKTVVAYARHGLRCF